MGCDYYICKYLLVKLSNSNSFSIEIENDRGYFYFNMDEDEPNYDKEYEEYIKDMLKVKSKPIIIYKDNQFSSNKLQEKYKNLIEFELHKFNENRKKNFDWNDIIEIIKKESRWERD
jgi:chromosomal replication initiation ATPase DnaA